MSNYGLNTLLCFGNVRWQLDRDSAPAFLELPCGRSQEIVPQRHTYHGYSVGAWKGPVHSLREARTKAVRVTVCDCNSCSSSLLVRLWIQI